MIKTKTLFATASKSYKKTLSYKKLKKTSKTVYTSITLIILAIFLIANISATEENLSNQPPQDNLPLTQSNISFVIENNSLPETETNNETASTTPEIPIPQTIPAPEEENPTNLPENNQEDSPQINSSLISPQSTEPRFSLFTTPSISAVIQNSTNPSTNDTNQNLTGFVTATDADSDNITFDYNWYKNGVLNSTTFFNDGTAILYLPLNNDTLDYALANDGSVINGALLNMNGGKVGGAYQFDGVNDFINFSASAISIGNNDRTISLWMKTPAAPAAGKSLWDTKQSDDFALSTIQLLTSGKIRFNVRDTAAEGGDEISGGTFDTTKVVSDNEWHLITAIWDTTNNAAYIYIDGVVNATATGITAIGTVTDTATANIGAAKDSANPAGVNFFNGTIDELILYNRTLSALEVKQLYIAGRDGGNVMGASQTEIGDNWTLGVRAADYQNWTAETNSSSIQVLGNVVPVISSVILNSTDTAVNDTTENLTSLVTATDSNTDNMTFIYNWYKENILNSTTAFFNGLALYLPLNNDTIDYGTNHTVEVLSAPAQIVSKVGNGYKFDGSDDYLRIVHEPVLNSTNEYTYSFWVNTTTTSNLVVVEKQIGGIGKNIIFSDDGNCGGRWVAGISTDAGDLICAGIEINDAKWHHIVVVLNSSNSSFYIDSILQASKDPSGTFNQGIGNITIGARNTGSFAFPGMIDEFQIYNRSLSKHEVYQLYIGSNWSGHTMHSSRLAQSDNWILGVKVGDSTGFSNETNSSTLQIPDSTTPVVTINQPINKTLNSLPVLFNVTINENSTTAQLSLNGGANNITMQNNANRDFNSTNTSLADGSYTVNYYVNDTTNNFNNTAKRSFTLDTIFPTVQYVDPTSTGSTFTTLKDILVNITSVDTNLANITIQLFNSSGARIRYNTTSTSPNNINYSNLADGDYSFNATAADLTNAINSTSSRNITIDTKAPNVTLITFYLNSSDSVDPSGNLTFNATVADNRMSVGTVILQYHNGTTWANKTMVSQGSNVYQANISLAITNQSYAYNIYANDTVGNINLTTNATFNSFFDCTFTRTPADLGATAGFNENKFTGNISINNTGDPDYPNNNCNLTFRLTHELTEGRVCFNNICFKPSNTIDIAAKVNTTIKTNGSFLSEIKEETFNISISELTFRASTNHSNASISLVSTTGGPYLFQKITASPATLSLITQNFTLEGYVRNLVGDGTTNNTAYNVTLNWTLTSDFLLRDGNTSSNFTNLSDNSLQQKPINITLNATNLPSMSAG